VLVRLGGREGLSRLYQFRFDFVVKSKRALPFEKLLGKQVTVRFEQPADLRSQGPVPFTRFFTGMIRSLRQGRQDDQHIHYRAIVVPRLWLLTRKKQSRIFQDLSVPDILKQVLAGLPAPYQPEFRWKAENYPRREYCVQYRETDFQFLSRLMQ